MAYLPELHRCAVCGVDLGPDDGDGICPAHDWGEGDLVLIEHDASHMLHSAGERAIVDRWIGPFVQVKVPAREKVQVRFYRGTTCFYGPSVEDGGLRRVHPEFLTKLE